MKSDSRQLSRNEGDSDRTGWLTGDFIFKSSSLFARLSCVFWSPENSLPSPPRLRTSSASSRIKLQRIASLERSSSCWRLSWLWSRHLPQRKWKKGKTNFCFYNIFPKCLQKYKNEKYHTDADSTMPRITPSKQSGRLPAEEESDLAQLLTEKAGGTLHTRLNLMFFSPSRLRISGVNWESSILTSFRLEQCFVTVNRPASDTLRQQLKGEDRAEDENNNISNYLISRLRRNFKFKAIDLIAVKKSLKLLMIGEFNSHLCPIYQNYFQF